MMSHVHLVSIFNCTVGKPMASRADKTVVGIASNLFGQQEDSTTLAAAASSNPICILKEVHDVSFACEGSIATAFLTRPNDTLLAG
jgi:hypothetical protein